MIEVQDVDLLVIGGGKAGKSLAMDRAKAGWKVAMVERDKIGGTCINVACIPTKSLVGSARTLLDARRAAVMGVELAGEPSISLDLLREHKESVVGGMVAAHAKMFPASGMDFMMGTARFTGDRTVEVALNDGGTRVLRGRDVVINTGTTPAVPPLDGIESADVWNSETILHLERIPESMIVLGGGYVGCEFASMFAVFGTKVILVQGRDQVLPREDPDVAAGVAGVLSAQGVELRLGARARAVRREGGREGRGDVVLTLEDGSEIRAEELLAATGRAPVTGDLGIDVAGVELTEKGFVAVDAHLRTSADHVWAVGDVAGSPQFTHASWNDYRVLRKQLTGGEATTHGRLVPYTVFTTPELARIGLSETEAREQGYEVKVARLDVAAIPRAKTLHDTTGTWKAVVDAATDRILGVALLGHGSGEVLSAVQMAMLGGLPYQQVRDAVITHPTMAEGLNLLFDTLGD
ncbi:pyruvate/2-oxoglutarate dehydrogenase complex dihydrolipoamide dehydrogenase (E3) component [Georgenia soli]|uniref:Pyruvate/2-oxoglutarate dehydrogenase complex dihydrolipoamide dehydrogenase (E3) component n=1 Tax=Georgenia soli TaxID=638953 RepID=A0A2A9EN61_9MICO|nr:FAD-dependent oxidoreductase [Georgenia soli]PFG39971.1 pyruvate/2-oxoglutarate dehydrogenase complex dihydrolipoamide dehydrogenase (E3) component [Georgenia soli]